MIKHGMKYVGLILLVLMSSFSVARAQTVPVDARVTDAYFFLDNEEKCNGHITIASQELEFPLTAHFFYYEDEPASVIRDIIVPDTGHAGGFGISFLAPCDLEEIRYVLDPENLIVETDETNNVGYIREWEGSRPEQPAPSPFSIFATQESDVLPGTYIVTFATNGMNVKSITISSSEHIASFNESNCVAIDRNSVDCKPGRNVVTVVFDGDQPFGQLAGQVYYGDGSASGYSILMADPTFVCDGTLVKLSNGEWFCKETVVQPPTNEEEIPQPNDGKTIFLPAVVNVD